MPSVSSREAWQAWLHDSEHYGLLANVITQGACAATIIKLTLTSTSLNIKVRPWLRHHGAQDVLTGSHCSSVLIALHNLHFH